MKSKALVLLALMLVLPVLCYASSIEVQDDGTKVGNAVKLNFTGQTITYSGDTATIPIDGADIVRNVQFMPGDFIINDASSVAPITTSTTPGLELDNAGVAIVWADGEATPVQVTFRVPQDYLSGGAFRAFVDESGDTTAAQIGYHVYVNADGVIFDSATSTQAVVSVPGLAGTPEDVALAVDTDFSALAAGNVVTFGIWRDDTLTGTNDLELYYAEFYYTASQ